MQADLRKPSSEDATTMARKDSRDVETHFAFGQNWASYAELIGPDEIAEAERGLEKLFPDGELAGRTFLDIGCGSGIHALAASRLGASRLFAIDIDQDSVDTTDQVLRRHQVQTPWRTQTLSVFELDPTQHGSFDVVYSWGVLHHTGDMRGAIRRAAAMVAPSGLLGIAIYRRTRMDWFWRREKRWYSRTSPRLQATARRVYIALFASRLRRHGGSLEQHIAGYRSTRGMDFQHDVHDWMGGYPYQAALAPEIDSIIRPLGFEVVRETSGPKTLGVLGSGCDEYVYRRIDHGAD